MVTQVGAGIDPYVRWKVSRYAAPGAQFLRPLIGIKSAARISGMARCLGRASILAGAGAAAYDTYEDDAFYEEDPSRAVSGWRKLGHASTSAALTAVGGSLGATVFGQAGGVLGGASGGRVGGLGGIAVGAPIGEGLGIVLGSFSGGQGGSWLAIQLNSNY